MCLPLSLLAIRNVKYKRRLDEPPAWILPPDAVSEAAASGYEIQAR
jgi:hypothetical protein